MNVEEKEPPVAVGEAARHRHLEDDLRTLVDRGLTYAKAEAEFQKARAGYATGKLKWIALLGAGALILVLYALVAFTVGMVFTLATLIGPLGATLVVFGVLAGTALACGLAALSQWRRMTAALRNREGS